MNLEWLNTRKAQLEQHATNLTTQYQTLQGHKAEVEHMISELVKKHEDEVVTVHEDEIQ